MNKNRVNTSSTNDGINGLFMSAVAFILALLIVVALIVVFPISKNNVKDTNINKGNSTTAQKTNKDEPSKPVMSNTTPLYPTAETRTSYKIGTASNVAILEGDSFIKSNNTILVKLDANGMTSTVEKNADQKMYPASMTKVMTLLVACERVTSLDYMLTIEKKHIDYLSSSKGGSSFFGNDEDNIGERISVKDALYLISYESDTISCLLIAEHIAGSEEAFVALMNQKAEYLKLSGTHFENCTGLYSENHYSTCRDIATIMAYATDNELARSILLSTSIYSFTSDKFYTTKDPNKKVTYYPNYPSWYDDRFNKQNKLETVTIIGGKTGYIDESGVSLVSYAEGANGQKYINVIVGQPKGSGLSESISTSEVKKIYNTYAK